MTFIFIFVILLIDGGYMKKRRVRKQVIVVLIVIIILIAGGIFGKQKYEEMKYHETYEYKLLTHGYTSDEVKLILDNFEETYYLYLLNNEVNSKYTELTKETYYLKKNFYKYIDYMKENDNLSLSEVVRNINIHLDNDFYEVEYNANQSLDTSILVNKFYLLGTDFKPDDLVVIPQAYAWGDKGSKTIRKVTYDAFLEMWNAANAEGYYLMVSSAYRTYEEQEIVYENYKTNRGQKYADGIAARPGASEHQTGLALDIFSKYNSNKNTFPESETYRWLTENAHKYGFILRYPEDKVDLTGYNYESWHYRYVGREIATYIYENKITFEEYYAYFIEK